MHGTTQLLLNGFDYMFSCSENECFSCDLLQYAATVISNEYQCNNARLLPLYL